MIYFGSVAMFFEQELIDLAKHLKSLSMEWEPEVGNYIYDANGIVKPSSPFQPQVYFLLNYDCFMQQVGGVERFRREMVWLPTWHDARKILRQLNVTDCEVQARVMDSAAIANQNELKTLYQIIEEKLAARSASQLSTR